MRILFLTNLYPPHELGGLEQLCEEVVNSLAGRGHDCAVLTSRYGLHGRHGTGSSVSRSLHLQANVGYYRPLNYFVKRPWQERLNQLSLRRAFDRFQPDVVFVWGMWNLSSRLAYWAEQWLPGRVAYSLGDYWPMEPDAHEAYWRQQARRSWVRALLLPARFSALRTLRRDRSRYPLAFAHVACASEYVRKKLNEAGVLPHGARVIYNGIDPEPFVQAAQRRTASGDQLRLVYTGSLSEHKGVHTAIQALALMKERGQSEGLLLEIVGSGHPDYEARLRGMVVEHGLGQQVSFRGRVPRSDISAILAEHDVFLFTSVYDEPFGRSVAEAMASGLPVLGTTVGGTAEVLEAEVDALVFPPDDPEALSLCILRLKRDPDLAHRLGEDGRRKVLERFTSVRMVDEMEEWLQEIAG